VHGQFIARTELCTAIEAVLGRLGEYQLAGVPRRNGLTGGGHHHGVEYLPVRFAVTSASTGSDAASPPTSIQPTLPDTEQRSTLVPGQRIDVHTHAMPEQAMAAAAPRVPPRGGYKNLGAVDTEAALATWTRDIAAQIVSMPLAFADTRRPRVRHPHLPDDHGGTRS